MDLPGNLYICIMVMYLGAPCMTGLPGHRGHGHVAGGRAGGGGEPPQRRAGRHAARVRPVRRGLLADPHAAPRLLQHRRPHLHAAGRRLRAAGECDHLPAEFNDLHRQLSVAEVVEPCQRITRWRDIDLLVMRLSLSDLVIVTSCDAHAEISLLNSNNAQNIPSTKLEKNVSVCMYGSKLYCY